MKLLILDGHSFPNPGRNPAYRGTDRARPTYCDSFPDEHEINRLFFWYLDEGGESGVVHDIQKAERYAELLNFQFRDTSFEVMEVVDGNDMPSGYGRFSWI
jgi:hypothetical protein